MLSAFDIATNLQPSEDFDLALGFSLGILDNDRSRPRAHVDASEESESESASVRRSRKRSVSGIERRSKENAAQESEHAEAPRPPAKQKVKRNNKKKRVATSFDDQLMHGYNAINSENHEIHAPPRRRDFQVFEEDEVISLSLQVHAID